MTIGWRKLLAWVMIWGLCAFGLWNGSDIPPNLKELLIWATTGFFFANAAKPAFQGLQAKFSNGG